MKDIVTFKQLTYSMGCANIIVMLRQHGANTEELFSGTIEDLHSRKNRELLGRLYNMEAVSIDAEDGMLLIGVGDINI